MLMEAEVDKRLEVVEVDDMLEAVEVDGTLDAAEVGAMLEVVPRVDEIMGLDVATELEL
jgi:hypothetical protein